jgi:hypothetical protein
MRITRPVWVGITAILAGSAVLGARLLWLEKRAWIAIEKPISLTQGRVQTVKFKSNLKSRYLIEIEVDRKIPFDTLNCLLGVEDIHPQSCTNTPSVLEASWVLWSQGVIAAQGSTASYRGGAWSENTIARQIGSFESEKGQQYTLELIVLADGSRLAVGDPRLKVAVRPSYYADYAYANIPYLVLGSALIVMGTIGIGVSIAKERDREKQIRDTR